MKVVINEKGQYLNPRLEPFPSFTDDENDVNIYFLDNVALIVAQHLKLKTIPKQYNTLMKECKRCNHKWLPRKKVQIRICPKCKSPYWDIAKK
jgi:hypothetical protein